MAAHETHCARIRRPSCRPMGSTLVASFDAVGLTVHDASDKIYLGIMQVESYMISSRLEGKDITCQERSTSLFGRSDRRRSRDCGAHVLRCLDPRWKGKDQFQRNVGLKFHRCKWRHGTSAQPTSLFWRDITEQQCSSSSLKGSRSTFPSHLMTFDAERREHFESLYGQVSRPNRLLDVNRQIMLILPGIVTTWRYSSQSGVPQPKTR